jgi:hypothetical protein
MSRGGLLGLVWMLLMLEGHGGGGLHKLGRMLTGTITGQREAIPQVAVLTYTGRVVTGRGGGTR